MGVLGVASVGSSFRQGACAALCCLLSGACGQTADAPKAASGGSGGTAETASTGGQSESTGGQTSGGSENVSSGGALVVGGSSTGGITVGGAAGGETVGSNGVAPHPAKECVAPSQSLLGGGFVVCEDGSYRRPRAAACAITVPTAETGFGCHPEDECCANTDCVKAPYGYCQYGACFYGCVSDADCDSGSVCHCKNPIGVCIASACRSDADCPAGFPCAAAYSLRELACQSPTDACLTDQDCGGTRVRCDPVPGGRTCTFLPG